MNSIVFSALAEPNRLEIVELLRSGPLSVGEITQRLGLKQPQASKHLQILSNAGLVEVSAVANRRIYMLRAQPLIELDVWLESFRNLAGEQFNHLDDYLLELLMTEKKHEKE